MSTLKRMQKLFAVLLVFTFVAGIVAVPGSAYAAKREPMRDLDIDVQKLISDIEDEDVKDAVLRLNAFGIVSGMGEDGKYHPEMKLTREQFAKILVTSLKMDDAAEAGVGYKSFPDVPAGRWSAGFVGVAAGQGLVEGYPDGTFKPTKEVTYAEAITMLVRALGYKDEFLPGGWPGNYLAKGAAKGITKKVKFTDAKGIVNRGDAAILVNNNLDAKVIKPDTYKGNVLELVESEKTLLEDRLELVKAEDARIVANKRIDDGLDEEEVRVYFRKDVIDPASKDQSKEYNKFDEKETEELDIVRGFNPEPYLGEEVTVYLNDDDEILYAEVERDDKAYFDYVEENNKKEITLAKADDDYEFDEDAYVYVLEKDKYTEYKGDEIRDKDNKKDLLNNMPGKVGKFVIKNRKIVYAEIMDPNEAHPWLIVMKNDDGLITGICEDDDDFELDLTKDGNYDGVIALDIDGNEIDLDDLEEGNLLYVQKQEYDGDDYAVVRVVTDNIVEGKLDRVIKENKLRLDKDEYKVTHYVDANGDKKFHSFYSIEDGEDIKCFEMTEQSVKDDIEDADEEDIVAYLDAVGRIAYFQTAAKATSGYKYGVVTRTYADNDRLKIFTIDEDGEDDEIVYRVEEEDDVEGARVLDEFGMKLKDSKYDKDVKANKDNFAEIKKGSVVKFKLNKAGEIAEDKLYVHKPENLWVTERKEDFGKDYLPKAYSLTDKDGKVIDNVIKGVIEEGQDDYGESGLKLNFGELKKQADKAYAFSVKDDVVVIDAETYRFDGKYDSKEDTLGFNDYYIKMHDTDDFSVAKWKDLSDANGIDSLFYVFADDNRKTNAKAAIFVGQGSGAASDDEIGIYVIDRSTKGGDVYVEYAAYGEKEIKNKELDDETSFWNKYRHEHPYIAKEKSNGKLEIITPGESKDGFDMVYGQIDERKSDYIELYNGYKYEDYDKGKGSKEDYGRKTFNISSKTVVYEEDDSKSTSNLSAGDYVIMVVEKGNNVRVIERLIDNEKADMKKLIGDKVDPEKDDPEDEEDGEELTYKGYYELDGNLYIELGGKTYPYVGGDEADLEALEEGKKAIVEFTEIRDEKVVKSVKPVKDKVEDEDKDDGDNDDEEKELELTNIEYGNGQKAVVSDNTIKFTIDSEKTYDLSAITAELSKPAKIEVEYAETGFFAKYNEAGEISVPDLVKSQIKTDIGKLKLQGSEILEKAEGKTVKVTLTELDEEGNTETYNVEFVEAQ